MAQAQAVTRKDVYRRLRNLPDDRLPEVIAFIDSIEEHEPNEETIAALREADDLDSLTTCTDLDDMLAKCGIKR